MKLEELDEFEFKTIYVDENIEVRYKKQTYFPMTKLNPELVFVQDDQEVCILIQDFKNIYFELMKRNII